MSSLVSSTQIGELWQWGFGAADAPDIGNGFHPTEGEARYGREVYTSSANGEGHVDSVTLSKKEKRKWESTFKGRIDDSFDPAGIPESFVCARAGIRMASKGSLEEIQDDELEAHGDVFTLVAGVSG